MIEENPSQEHQENTGTSPETITPQHAPMAEVPPPPPIPPAQQTSSESAGDPAEGQQAQAVDAIEKDLSKFERKILHATWAGVAAAAITGVVIYSQFRVMTDQTQILSSQTIGAIADSIESGRRVEKQLAIAQQQANAAQDSVKAIQRQIRQDQRAWMKISAGDFATIEGQPLSVPITLTNIGKTAATNIVLRAVVSVIPINKAPALNFRGPFNETTTGVIYPNEPPRIPIPSSWLKSIPNKEPESILLTETHIQNLRNGNTYVATYARLTYLDIFGVQHWVNYCTWGGRLVPKPMRYHAKECSDYNSTDNN